MSLLELQRRVAAAIFAPAAPASAEARAILKPNSRLTSSERLDIYRDSYWQRVLGSFADDFPGLRAIVGPRAFQRLAKAYLSDSPSQSFTLRNLGSRLEEWLRSHPDFAGKNVAAALDMVRLEWAHIEAFDGAAVKPLGPEDLLLPGPEMRVSLQPHITLLELQYPVDDLRIQSDEVPDPRALARRMMRRPSHGSIFLAVHRVEFDVFYRRLAAEEYRILDSLRKGAAIGETLDGVSEPGMVETWFANWSRLGWLCSPDNTSR
jgi:hypothetical protein